MSRTIAMHNQKQKRIRPNSFTLVELLVVLAIAVILGALSVPAVTSLMRSSNLSSGGNNLVNQLTLSRQVAMTRNCQVEFRLYQLPDSSGNMVYRAFQSFSLDNDGTQTNAITQVTYLPGQIYMVNNSTASTLLTANNPPYVLAGTAAGISLGTYPPSSYNYVAFHFNVDGSTDLNPGSGQSWHVSLANERDATQGSAGLPANFMTVQVDAQTGRVRSFRPN
jgi:uncharacterized protein (TIGR02596 family)